MYTVRKLKDEDHELALGWLNARIEKMVGVGYPKQFLPHEGLCAVDKSGNLTGVLFLLHDKEAKLAVCCHAIVPPGQSPRISYESLNCIFQRLPMYASRELGCIGLFSTFGHRGINRLLDDLPGWLQGDSDAVHHMMIL